MACVLNYVAFLCGLTARQFQFYKCYCCFVHFTAVLYMLLLFCTCYCHRTKCDYFVNIQVVLGGMNSAVSLKKYSYNKINELH